MRPTALKKSKEGRRCIETEFANCFQSLTPLVRLLGIGTNEVRTHGFPTHSWG